MSKFNAAGGGRKFGSTITPCSSRLVKDYGFSVPSTRYRISIIIMCKRLKFQIPECLLFLDLKVD